MSFLDRLREFAAAFERVDSVEPSIIVRSVPFVPRGVPPGQSYEGSETFTRLKKDAPAWLRGDAGTKIMSIIAASVGGGPIAGVERAPDDWIYQATAEVAWRLVEQEPIDAREARRGTRKIEGLADVLYSRLTAWLAGNFGNLMLCDEAVEELGVPESAPIIQRIRAGQHLAYVRIIKAVIDVCESADEGMMS